MREDRPLPQTSRDAPGVVAWAVFVRAHAVVVRVLEHEMEEQTGLPLSWYDVLLELRTADERRLRMQDLASRVVLSRTRVSRVVDQMVVAGLVDKVPDPDDGRATFAVLTTRGRRVLTAAAPVYLRGIEEHFARHLTSEQQRTVGEALEQVIAATHATGD